MPIQDDNLFESVSIQTEQAIEQLQSNPATGTSNPANGMLLGSTGTVFAPDNSSVDYQYAVVPSNRLITSHTSAMGVNPAYDASLQGRDRARAASGVQIAGIAASLNPERLGASAMAGEGAPIIGDDWMVESGNGRTLSVLKAQQDNMESAAAYREYLLNNAEQFGLNRSDIEGIENPMLVRVRRTEMNAEERARFASVANNSSVATLSESERASRDAEALMNSSLLNRFDPREDGTFANIGGDFPAQFATLLPPSEFPSFIQSDGSLSAAGHRQMRNALLGAAYPNSGLIGRMTEELDGGKAGIGKALLDAAGPMARMNQIAAESGIAGLGIGGNVAEAANLINEYPRMEKGRSVSLEEHLATSSMFGDSETTNLLARTMDANRRSPKFITELLSRYARAVSTYGNPAEGSLFGDGPPPPENILASIISNMASERAPDNSLELDYESPSLEAVRGKASAAKAVFDQSAIPGAESETPTPSGAETVSSGGGQSRGGGRVLTPEQQELLQERLGAAKKRHQIVALQLERQQRMTERDRQKYAPPVVDDTQSEPVGEDNSSPLSVQPLSAPWNIPTNYTPRSGDFLYSLTERPYTALRSSALSESLFGGESERLANFRRSLQGRPIELPPARDFGFDAERRLAEFRQGFASPEPGDAPSIIAGSAYSPSSRLMFPPESPAFSAGERAAPPWADASNPLYDGMEAAYQANRARASASPSVADAEQFQITENERRNRLYGDPADYQSWRVSNAPVYDNIDAPGSPRVATRSTRIRSFETHRDYKDALADHKTDLSNIYSQRGDGDRIGSPQFERDYQSRLSDAGLVDEDEELPFFHPRSLGRRFAGSLRGQGAYAFGYGLMQFGNEASADYVAQNRGAYLTPEEKQTANAGMLPGALSVIGAGVGAFFGNPILGGFVGQGIGSIASGAIGASDANSQALRETSQALAASMGDAASSVAGFTRQIEQSGVAAQQYQQIVNTVVSQGGPVGSGFVAGSTAMTNSLQEYAPANFASVVQQLNSDPALASPLQRFLDGGKPHYGSLGVVSAIEGDIPGVQQDSLGILMSRLNHNTDYQNAVKTQNNHPGWYTAGAKWLHDHGMGWIDQADGDGRLDTSIQTTEGDTHEALSMPSRRVAHIKDLTREFEDIKSNRAGQSAQMAMIGGRLSNLLLEGQGAGAYDTMRSPMQAMVGDELATDAYDVSKIQAEIANPANARDKDFLNEALSKAYIHQASDSVEMSQFNHAALTSTISQNAANFGRYETLRTLGGASAASLAGSVGAEAHALHEYANNEYADPALRAELISKAAMLQHQNMMQGYAQTLGQADVGIAATQMVVGAAREYADPSKYAGAYGYEIKAYTEKIADLNDELRKGGLTVDERISKEQQLASAIQQRIALPGEEKSAYYSAEGGILSAGIGVVSSDASMAAMTGGSAAAVPILAQRAMQQGGLISMYDDAARSAPSPGERAAYAAKAAAERYAQMQTMDSEAGYNPDPNLASQLAIEQGQLQRLNMGFLEPGNVNDARGAMLGGIGQELNQLSAQEAARKKAQGGSLTDYQNYRYTEERQNLLTQQAQIGSEMDLSYFDKLPAMTVGGTSFMGRYLPSAAQTAVDLENRGFGTLSARNFGYTSDSSYESALSQSGGLLDAGKSTTGILANDQTAKALAAAIKSGLSGTTFNIVISGAHGTTKTTAVAQTNQQRTQGLSAMPGVGAR